MRLFAEPQCVIVAQSAFDIEISQHCSLILMVRYLMLMEGFPSIQIERVQSFSDQSYLRIDSHFGHQVFGGCLFEMDDDFTGGNEFAERRQCEVDHIEGGREGQQVEFCYDSFSVGIDDYFRRRRLVVGTVEHEGQWFIRFGLGLQQQKRMFSMLQLSHSASYPFSYKLSKGVDFCLPFAKRSTSQFTKQCGSRQNRPVIQRVRIVPTFVPLKASRVNLIVFINQSWLPLCQSQSLYSFIYMDKTYNFFKNRGSPPRSNSHSKSRPQPTQKPTQLTVKERQIREAIEYRYLKSKMRAYQFARLKEVVGQEESESEGEEQLQALKGLQTVDLREYHHRLETTQNTSSSQERRRFNLRFKIQETKSGTIVRSQASNSAGKKPLLGKLPKNLSPSTTGKRTDQWNFMSIKLKEEGKRKTDLRTNSQRSQLDMYRSIEKTEKSKVKSNSTLSKHADKIPRLHDLGKLNHSKF